MSYTVSDSMLTVVFSNVQPRSNNFITITCFDAIGTFKWSPSSSPWKRNRFKRQFLSDHCKSTERSYVVTFMGQPGSLTVTQGQYWARRLGIIYRLWRVTAIMNSKPLPGHPNTGRFKSLLNCQINWQYVILYITCDKMTCTSNWFLFQKLAFCSVICR